MIDLEKLCNLAKSGSNYEPSCGLTPAAYAALARASSVRETRCVIGGEVHGLVPRADGLFVLAIGEVGGPVDPDLTAA